MNDFSIVYTESIIDGMNIFDAILENADIIIEILNVTKQM